MKFFLLLLFFFFLTLIIFTPNVEARRGCCSHHGGVCGCSCCDGTSLSATCAPYYPSCNSSNSYNSYSANTCPPHSTYSYSQKSCICDNGYAPSLNLKYCVKIPEHAHVVNSKTDVWLCDDGYEEKNNSCVLKKNCEIDGQEVLISRVVDGDTVEFNCNGSKEKIRIIGIDTPETVHPSKPVECFGKEASKKNERISS